jgi:inositol oxygenase
LWLQVAELCRVSFPDKPWMALVGLLHGLGKLLAHPMWGSQPQWAVAGESFPVGCKFAPQISASEFFSANPDRCVDKHRRVYCVCIVSA